MSILQDAGFLITILNIFLAITVIFLERRSVATTWAWIMVLFFIPIAGFVLYLIFGQKIRRRKLNKLLGSTQRIIEETVDKQKHQLMRHELAFNDPSMEGYRDMIYMNLRTSYALYTQNNSVAIFTDGPTKFDALFRDIEAATHHIHLVYYIVRNDDLGRRLVQALTAKAKEGVEVRFLFDHIGSFMLPSKFFNELKAAGGKVQAFFPSRIPYLNLKLNYRNHRKLVILDGGVGYIGGFNVGNEYLGLNKSFGAWRDTHLRMQGHAVQQLQAQFFMDWNLASAERSELGRSYFPRGEEEEASGAIGVQVVASGPDTEAQQIKAAYIKMIHSAKHSVYLQTPYFVPDESLMDAMLIAAQSGVDVRIMLPDKPDHFFVYWATQSYIGELLAGGVRVYRYERGFLHAKTLVIDGKIASVGTANLDIRSFKLNFEMNAFLYDTATAEQLQRIFAEDMASSYELTMSMYATRPYLNRFKESVSRLLSPIL
ncbi:cardiolipin synthase [Paenibacillus sp. GCM10023252]|uniref:cardiolipin synthase n=1 Tax=Paenibacillus sp. GCM10023252 TaxID=3252649 RepID=UPI00361D2B99